MTAFTRLLSSSALILTLCVLASACRPRSTSDKTETADAPPATQAAPPAPDPQPRTEPELLAPRPELLEKLPKLQPATGVPLAEVKDEKPICLAIDNTSEKDLWARFGHLIPLHVWGSIFVVRKKDLDIAAIKSFIEKDYFDGMYLPQVATCRDDSALIWARRMPDDTDYYGRRMGREHFAKELQKKLGVNVSESFAIPMDFTNHLSDYCWADAEICEKLVKLDYANKSGLCGTAAALLGNASESFLRSCSSASPKLLACVYFVKSGPERELCIQRIEASLTP